MTITTEIDPFDSLFEPPEVIVGLPITGNGMAAIREWVVAVERHFGGQGLASIHRRGFRAGQRTVGALTSGFRA